MPDFIAEFANSITSQSQNIKSLFSRKPDTAIEEQLANAIANQWHSPLPLANFEQRAAYAVDGSGAIRFFDNGACMIVSHALLERAGHEETATDVIFRRGNISNPVLERYRDLTLRRIEIQIALDHLDSLAKGILYLDGSLYAELPHLLYPLDIQEAADLPLLLMEMYLELWRRCQELDIVLIGVSKTSRGNLLSNTFLNLLDGSDTIPADISDAELVSSNGKTPTDAEVLYRWTEGPGFSTPILVGMQSFGHRRKQLRSNSSGIVEAYRRRGVSKEWAHDILDNILSAPSIAAWYVRFNFGDDPLRVEVPATLLGGESPSMVDFYSKVISPSIINRVLGYLHASYGGSSVYNAPIYTADRKVRLNRRVVDQKYLNIIRQVVGRPVNFDRSTRRFSSR